MIRKVLVVDDDRPVREALAQTLELADYTVRAAGSFIEAKDHITPEFEGVILSDIRMPGRDGFHLLAHTRALDDELPVILLTALGDRDAVRQEIEQERSASRDVAEKMNALKTALETHRSRLTDLVGQEARYRNIHQAAQNNRESLQRRLKKTDEEAALAARTLSNARGAETRSQAHLVEKQETLRVLERQIGDVRQQLENKSRKLSEQIKLGQALDLDRNKLRSRYTTLKKMEDNFEWYRDGVRARWRRLYLRRGRRGPGARFSACSSLRSGLRRRRNDLRGCRRTDSGIAAGKKYRYRHHGCHVRLCRHDDIGCGARIK